MAGRDPKTKKNAPVTRRAWWLIPVALLGAFFVLTGGGFLAAKTLEERDSFCASCHSEPEATYYQRSLAAQPSDLASYHRGKSTRCIDCHAGPGLSGRLAAMRLGAGDLLAFALHTAVQPAPLTQPIDDPHCLKCHADAVETRDMNRHFHAFLSQWQARDPKAATCVDCHQAHPTNGDPKLQFLNRQHTQDICQRCHSALGEGG